MSETRTAADDHGLEPDEPPTRNPSVTGSSIERFAPLLVIPAVVALVWVALGYLKDEDASKVPQVLVAVLIGSAGVWALFWAMDRSVNLLPERASTALRPWVFIGPAMALLSFYLVYPALNTVWLSLRDKDGESWVGLDNFEKIVTTSEFQIGIRNSFLWVLLVPFFAVAIGLGFATLVDKLGAKAESRAKSLIFLPMAISFVGAAVVWTFVYAFRPEGFGQQIGLLNAAWTGITNSDPVNWYAKDPWNNLYLMVILVWLQTGFSMVILSSAIKGVPEEILEAARIDGASEWQAFWRIVFPTIASTIVVVWTTVVITVWKVFDIVFVTTGGRNGSQVVAQQMVEQFFTNQNDGLGSALAVVLFIAVIPVLIINVRRFRAEEALR